MDGCNIKTEHTGQDLVYKEGESCPSISPKGNYCNKEKDHIGSHAACRIKEHNIEIWND